jgi:hypothetical protein
MMNPKDRYLAEATLQHLLLGARINGVRFGNSLQLLMGKSDKLLLKGQIYVNVESPWILYPTALENISADEHDIPALSVEEELKIIYGLREQAIVAVRLGELSPHLLLTLASGHTLFLNGKHDFHECWQVGVSMGRPDECWRIVSCPGGDIATWAPQQFIEAVLNSEASLMLL